VIAGAHAVGRDELEVLANARRRLLDLLGVDLAQLLLREQTRLDALGEVDLLLGVEEGDPADVGQVDTDQVGRGDLVVPGVDDVVLVDGVVAGRGGGFAGRRGAGRVGADLDAALADQPQDTLGLGRTDTRLVEGAANLTECQLTLLRRGVEKILDGAGQSAVRRGAGDRGGARDCSSPPRASKVEVESWSMVLRSS
jgi:hypothetical protein